MEEQPVIQLRGWHPVVLEWVTGCWRAGEMEMSSTLRWFDKLEAVPGQREETRALTRGRLQTCVGQI